MAQNYKNHLQYVPLFHFVVYPLIAVIFVSSLIHLTRNLGRPHHGNMPVILLGISIVLGLLAFFSRRFALKAQDRAIRAEENLRHFALTGKLLDPRLRLGQIIALRFASDQEFPALATQAAEKNLDSKTIKQSITHWREDNHRV